VLKSATAPDEERELAAKILFNADDAAALAKGIATILPDASLLETHGPELERIAATGNLGTLDLKDKGLTGELPASVMQLMGSAEYFNLHGNSFSNISEGTALHNMVYGMTNWRDRKELIWKFEQGGGNFSSLPGEIGLFVSLVTLDLSQNNLTGLPKMDGCSSLTDLSLESCKLTAEGLAEFCAHSPPALQKLNLSHCHALKSLPKLDGCSSLVDLNLGYCEKLTADGLFEFCAVPPPALQKLSLNNDRNLETVPDSISKLQNLKDLNFRNTAITALPPSIGDCKSLTSLNLYYCWNLAAIPDSISKLQNLKDLDLHGTAITGESNPLDVVPMLQSDIITIYFSFAEGDRESPEARNVGAQAMLQTQDRQGQAPSAATKVQHPVLTWEVQYNRV